MSSRATASARLLGGAPWLLVLARNYAERREKIQVGVVAAYLARRASSQAFTGRVGNFHFTLRKRSGRVK
ncbi:hypothetical protein, partial [Salmonella enterica]|uniref:hypothetical protein n=1 Tax=Salmonella enterica TaxID=28901 RepID=UPI001C3F3211